MAWTIDPAHARIGFAVRHMMLSTVRGEFTRFDGQVELDEDDPTAARVDLTIDAASIDTRNEMRDQHLRSDDFLAAERYPELRFRSTRVERLDEHRARLHGQLTIRGVTRPVTLEARYEGRAVSPWGTLSAGFRLEGRLNRKDWGLTWNQALESGGLLVGEEVRLDIEVELIRQAESAPVAEPAFA
jgi:polyisoprenoid-binding protein YceI